MIDLDPPSPDDVARIAAGLGLQASQAEQEAILQVGHAMLGDYQALDEWPDPPLAGEHERDCGSSPKPAENPVNGWVWRISIEGTCKGPLSGVDVALKDNIALAGAPMLNGSEFFAGYVPREDATVVSRLLEAGATITGKTAVPAFCFEGAGLFGYPEPLTLNPRDHSRLPGGSSSGCAAVVANREAAVAIGGDQGGSIRIPAAWCGCVGLKPTFGLVPYTGVAAVELTLDSIGPIARSVVDCARVLDAIAGTDGLDPRQSPAAVAPSGSQVERGVEGLRLGVLEEGFALAGISEPDVDASVRAACQRLSDAGATVEPVSITDHARGLVLWNIICIQGATDVIFRTAGVGSNWRGRYMTDLAEHCFRNWTERAAALPPTLTLTLVLGQYVTEQAGYAHYAKAQNLSASLRHAYDRALKDFDALLMPTTPMKAPPVPADNDAASRLELAVGLASASNVAPFNVTGHPALTVPCGTEAGLPIGLMIVARHGEDATTLRVGRGLELSTSAP